jgi:hypothetical protein
MAGGRSLSRAREMEFQHGKLSVKNWGRLTELGRFDPQCLSQKTCLTLCLPAVAFLHLASQR